MISKEISTLENDLLEPKESLSEWNSMPSLLHVDDSASIAGKRHIVITPPPTTYPPRDRKRD